MTHKIVLGLTGGIASGKSSVLKEFKRLGARVLDSDRIVRKMTRPGMPACRKILKDFGAHFFRKDGVLMRKKLARAVFSDPGLKRRLEKLIHPGVINTLKDESSRVRSGVVIMDIPLLYEAGLEDLVDKTAVVWVPLKVQLKRLMQRNSLGREDALHRLNSQWSLSKKKKLADVVIDNGGSFKDTKRQISRLFEKLLDKK